jgi:predicted RNase H-like nuclease
MRILGLDLAWGERNPDGVALLEVTAESARLVDSRRVQGDEALLEWVEQSAPPGRAAFLLIDAPVVCPNTTGARPVDRESHRVFGRQHAGCHPSNLRLCARPLRLVGKLQALGFGIGWEPSDNARQMAEVYPHAALVRFFALDQILKYKRGPVSSRRREFLRLQTLIADNWTLLFPSLERGPLLEELLGLPWTKEAEDRLDAVICALIGLHHVSHHGHRSEVLGDLDTGFLLVPRKS